MKRLVRSIIDPAPRPLSVKSLAMVVGMLLCGIGVSVHEYLESGRPAVRATRAPAFESGACRGDACRASAAPLAPLAPSGRVQEPIRTTEVERDAPARRPTASAPGPAATQWVPESEPGSDPTDESRAETGSSRIGTVSGQ